ncbi:MAG: hypothetical protein AB1665_02455 [Candidatus Thermoplasmatota archaeon]
MRYGRGLCARGLCTVIIGVLLATVVPPLPSAAGEEAPVELRVIGEQAQYINQTNRNYSVLVIGVLHELVVDVPTEPQNVHICAYLGTQEPSIQNVTNYYEWAYQDGVWADLLYGLYLNSSLCRALQGEYTFVLGVDENATVGVWSLIVSADGSEVWNDQIIAKDPLLGTGVQPADEIEMVVPPFSTSEVRLSSLHLPRALPTIVRPDGNVPISVEAVCNPYPSNFLVTNLTGIIHIGEKRTLDIVFVPQHGWTPQRFTTNLTLTFREETLPSAPPTGMVVIKEEAALTMRIVVEVKRTGYELLDLGNGLYVQYMPSVALSWQERTELSLFLTGNETIDLKITGHDITVERIAGGAPVAQDTLRLALTSVTEHEVTVDIYADIGDINAYVDYRITRNGMEADPFFTVVHVGSGSPYQPPPLVWNLYVLAVLGAIVLAVILVGLHYIRREKARRRELAKKRGRRKR